MSVFDDAPRVAVPSGSEVLRPFGWLTYSEGEGRQLAEGRLILRWSGRRESVVTRDEDVRSFPVQMGGQFGLRFRTLALPTGKSATLA